MVEHPFSLNKKRAIPDPTLTLAWFSPHSFLNTWNLDMFYTMMETGHLGLFIHM